MVQERKLTLQMRVSESEVEWPMFKELQEGVMKAKSRNTLSIKTKTDKKNGRPNKGLPQPFDLTAEQVSELFFSCRRLKSGLVQYVCKSLKLPVYSLMRLGAILIPFAYALKEIAAPDMRRKLEALA